MNQNPPERTIEPHEETGAIADREQQGSVTPGVLDELAKAVGGTIEEVVELPDGSGFATMNMPLPSDHWLTQPGDNVPPIPFRMGTDDPKRKKWTEGIRAAGRYAVRSATQNGEVKDFDPDALVQSLIVGILGYYTSNGLSEYEEGG